MQMRPVTGNGGRARRRCLCPDCRHDAAVDARDELVLEELMTIHRNDLLRNTLRELGDDEPKYLDAFVTILDTDPGQRKSELIYLGAVLQLREMILKRADKMKGDELVRKREEEFV